MKAKPNRWCLSEEGINLWNLWPPTSGPRTLIEAGGCLRWLLNRWVVYWWVQCHQGKKAYTSYADRKYILEAIRYVDEVIPERDWEQKVKDVQANQVDIFVMGDDWQGKFDFLKDYCQVVYLPRTQGISTTKIKEDLEKKGRG